MEMASLTVPVIAVVIGEGGSGGAFRNWNLKSCSDA